MAVHHSFTFKHGNLVEFIQFSAGDPYYLDFSEGGQQGTVSWSTSTLPYEAIKDGFKVSYNPATDQEILNQINNTVVAFNKLAVEVPE